MPAFSTSHLAVAFRILSMVSNYEGTDSPDDRLTEYVNNTEDAEESDITAAMSKHWIFNLLREAAFIKDTVNDRGAFPYRITWKGVQFLEYYRHVTKNNTVPVTDCSDDSRHLLFLFT